METKLMPSQNPGKPLTKAESEISRLLLSGCTRRQIAAERGITLSCVNFHIQNIYKKTDCKTINMFLLKYRRS